MMRFYFFLIIFSTCSISSIAKVIYVGSSGNYTTIQEAADIAVAGDTVFINPGIYAELVSPVNSGTVLSPIVYLGSTSGDVVIDAENNTRAYCIQITGKNNLVFENIKATGALQMGINLQGPSSNIVFNNLEVFENNHPQQEWSYGIVVDGELGKINNITIENCNIYNNRGHGLYMLNDVENVLIEKCLIHDNGHTEQDSSDNIVIANLNNDEFGPKNIEIRNCELYQATRHGLSTWFAHNIWIHDCNFYGNGATGVQVGDGTTNFIIENNVMDSNQQLLSTESGIWIDGAKYGVIKNNSIKNNQFGIKVGRSDHVIIRNNAVFNNISLNNENRETGGIAILADSVANNTNIAIIHNTFFRTGRSEQDYKNSMVAFEVYDHAVIENCYLYNNLFSIIINGYYLSLYSDNSTPIEYHSDYNLIYDENTLKVSSQGDELTFNEYLNFAKQEVHSKIGQSEMNNPDAEDFSFPITSPCFDNGKFLTTTVNAGTGNQIQVEKALFFNDGYGISSGDSIKIGANEIVLIKYIDYENNIIELNKAISWSANDNVSFGYAYNAPDIGAFEKAKSTYLNTNDLRKKSNIQLSASPNPFQVFTNIGYRIEYDSQIEIEIIDELGRIVKRFKSSTTANRYNEVSWTPNKSSSNYYTIKLNTEKESIVSRIFQIH